ncbi:MAG: DedA family protein [Syntrophales bacterium]|jgi:membrane-associated protein
MDLIAYLFDFFIHLDRHLSVLIQNFGGWSYLILFLIIFCETGLVVTPILPGDSLLFGLGTFAAMGALDITLLAILLPAAAITGDSVNYTIGRIVGPRVFKRPDSRFLKKEYLDRTHRFYERHGGKTIILAQYMPIIRTYAPFVAGIGKMSYRWFITFNVIGCVSWVMIFLFGGYYFGNIRIVKNNFTFVIMAIVIISVLPAFIEYFRHKVTASS